MPEVIFGNSHYLFRGLALREDHLRHAVAQRPVVVHLGKAEIFEWQMPHALHRRIHFHRAASYLLQQRPEMLLIHDDKDTNSQAYLAPAQTREYTGTKQF
jgi:hypothetical protein